MRKTKIVCTLGPATDNYTTIKRLIKAGMNVARLNMSHGNYEEHRARIKMIKDAREELDTAVAIMLDTKGPEIRIKTFENGAVMLYEGDFFALTTEDVIGNNLRVSISYPRLPEFVKEGDCILLNDGLIELKVYQVAKTEIMTVVVTGGELSNRKSINLPGVHIDMPYLSDVDKKDIEFGVQEGVDYFALSFVRTVDDVRTAKRYLYSVDGTEIKVIAKIENREGVNSIEKIIEECDGAMVARGDMGVEIPFEELPAIQKKLIKLCYFSGKIVITATQMLESMISNTRPTRAEISDVANAIYDGTSATMLSGETAAGKYPVEAVKTMAKIIEYSENDINYHERFKKLDAPIGTVTDAVSHASVSAAFDLKAKAIIAVTNSGYTARKVSRFRPPMPIIACTTSVRAYWQLALNWGVYPAMSKMQSNSDELFIHAMNCAKNTGIVHEDDLVIITGGTPVGISGTSNTLRIETIK